MFAGRGAPRPDASAIHAAARNACSSASKPRSRAPTLGRRPTRSTSCTTAPRVPSLPTRSAKPKGGRPRSRNQPSARSGGSSRRARRGSSAGTSRRPSACRRIISPPGSTTSAARTTLRAVPGPKAFSPTAPVTSQPAYVPPRLDEYTGRARSCSARRRWISRRRAPPPTTQTQSSPLTSTWSSRERSSVSPPSHGTEPPIAVDAAPRRVTGTPWPRAHTNASATSSEVAGRNTTSGTARLKNLVNSGPR